MRTKIQSSSPTTVVNKMVVQCYYESGINRRRTDIIDVTHHRDWSGHFVAPAVVLHGQRANQGRLDVLIEAVPDVRVEVRDLISMHDRVIARFTITGTDPATRRPFSSNGFGVHRLVHGRIVHEYVVNDLLARLAKTPVAPPNARLERLSTLRPRLAGRSKTRRRQPALAGF